MLRFLGAGIFGALFGLTLMYYFAYDMPGCFPDLQWTNMKSLADDSFYSLPATLRDLQLKAFNLRLLIIFLRDGFWWAIIPAVTACGIFKISLASRKSRSLSALVGAICGFFTSAIALFIIGGLCFLAGSHPIHMSALFFCFCSGGVVFMCFLTPFIFFGTWIGWSVAMYISRKSVVAQI